MINSRQPQRGFVLLFTVLTASVILAATLAISRIVTKEILLASVGRDSQQAFFAADSGAECAIYWNNQGKFAETPSAGSANEIKCNGYTLTDGVENLLLNSLNWNIIKADFGKTDLGGNIGKNKIDGSLVSVFALSVKEPPSGSPPSLADGCALVVVIRNTTRGITSIISRGYNTCRVAKRRVERALEVTVASP